VEKYSAQELAADAIARWDPAVKARGELVTAVAEEAGFILPPHPAASRWTQGFRLATDIALEAYRSFAADGDVGGYPGRLERLSGLPRSP
jgi:hypothetical protein